MDSEDEDFGLPEEEEEPESLRRKWESEEWEEQIQGKKTKPCPHCGKEIEEKSFSCLFCGGRVFEDSGLLGRMAQRTSRGIFVWLVFLIVISFGLLMILF